MENVGVLIVKEISRLTEWFTEENHSRFYEILARNGIQKILLLNALT